MCPWKIHWPGHETLDLLTTTSGLKYWLNLIWRSASSAQPGAALTDIRAYILTHRPGPVPGILWHSWPRPDYPPLSVQQRQPGWLLAAQLPPSPAGHAAHISCLGSCRYPDKASTRFIVLGRRTARPAAKNLLPLFRQQYTRQSVPHPGSLCQAAD